ncbi:adenylate/guanylate cyclase domain-containing protein [Rhizobium sp. LEGMi198b]
MAGNDIGQLVAGLCRRLIADGLPIWQASIAMPSIHPVYRGVSARFARGAEAVTENAEYESVSEESFTHTPIFYLLENGLLFGRWQIARGDGVDFYPDLADLQQKGGTDHVVNLVSFPTEVALRGMALSVTTDCPTGFSDAHLETLKALLPSLGLACYRMAATKTATDMLAVYTGAKTSVHILGGETQRGAGGALYAAILLADLSNFTALTESHSRDEIVAMLNQRFELVGRNVEEHNGEILKFMGDSVLAIFPADIDCPKEACRNAVASARHMLMANAALNNDDLRRSGPPVDIDIVLHLGEVFYGNIGARGRLDFTVIGPAVNETSRLEKLCDQLQEHLLLSESFATACGLACDRLGDFKLRGVSKPAGVFKLA